MFHTSSLSTIESLSAEFWCEIFEFFDAIELYRTFGNLNSTISSILSYNTPLHINITTGSDYDFVFDIILSKVNNRANVKSIKFRGEYQIEEFFSRCPFSSLPQLRCLSLVYLGEMVSDCSMLLLEQLAQLPYFECLHIRVGRITHYDRCLKRLVELMFTEHDAFRSLKQVFFQCYRRDQLLYIPTPAKHIQLESIALPSVYLTTFLSMLSRTLRLKSIKVNSLHSDSDETIPIYPSSANIVLWDCAYLNLHLAYYFQFDGIKLVLEKVPNLTQLKIACDFALVNGDRWETLLTEHCPRLRKLEIQFSPYHHFFNRAPLSELQQSFSTTFWLERDVQIEHDNHFYRLIIRFRIE